MRCVVLLAIVVVMPVRAQDAPPAVEKLVEQLGSPSFPARERAMKALRARGPAALPALRKALESTDEEVRKRAESLVPPLEIDEALLPKRVSLPKPVDSGLAALQDIARQTGYKLDFQGKVPVSLKEPLRFADATFWDALDQLCQATGTSPSYDSYQKAMRLSPAPGRSPFRQVNGPFRLEATWFHEDRDLAFFRSEGGKDAPRDHRLTLSVSVLAEPRITFLKVGPAQVTEAVDSEGKSLVEPVGGPKVDQPPPGRGTFRGESTQYSDVRLKRASESAKSVKTVRGTIPVKSILIRKPVVVTNKVLESLGTKFRAGTDGLEITRVTNQGGGSVEVQVAVPREQNQNWQWTDRFHVEDDAGNRFQMNGTGSQSNGRQYWVSMYYSPPFNKNAGPPTKFILDDWVVHDHAIPFEFRDVPLP